MIILGIETSCDETAAAIVQDGTTILAQAIASSQSMYAKYGGIIPDRAAREQLKSILTVIHEVLESSNLNINNLDAIAVTTGPGLIGSLLVGVETAKTLTLTWDKPLIPVNHLIAHLYANWVNVPNPPQFPTLALLVSGGHTELILMENHGKLKILGSTRDDAAGECFDKCGRVLGFPYPYGPYFEKEAEKFSNSNSQFSIKLPRPMIYDDSFDFSFSGLKTAFVNEHHKLIANHYSLITPRLAYELQEAITDTLVAKTLKAVETYQPKSLLLAGGVCANKCLRDKISLEIENCKLKIELYIPPVPLCTDNAVTTASAAFFNYHPTTIEDVQATPDLSF